MTNIFANTDNNRGFAKDVNLNQIKMFQFFSLRDFSVLHIFAFFESASRMLYSKGKADDMIPEAGHFGTFETFSRHFQRKWPLQRDFFLPLFTKSNVLAKFDLDQSTLWELDWEMSLRAIFSIHRYSITAVPCKRHDEYCWFHHSGRFGTSWYVDNVHDFAGNGKLVFGISYLTIFQLEGIHTNALVMVKVICAYEAFVCTIQRGAWSSFNFHHHSFLVSPLINDLDPPLLS